MPCRLCEKKPCLFESLRTHCDSTLISGLHRTHRFFSVAGPVALGRDHTLFTHGLHGDTPALKQFSLETGQELQTRSFTTSGLTGSGEKTTSGATSGHHPSGIAAVHLGEAPCVALSFP